MLDQHSIHYYQRRAIAAQANAMRATDERARLRHLEMASVYIEVVETKRTVQELTRSRSTVFILPDDEN